MGISASPNNAEKFGEQIKQNLQRFGPVVKAAGIPLQ